MAKIDGGVPIARPRRLTDLVLQATGEERLLTALLATMAALASLLAMVGLYGVVSYVVTQRTREFGIRLALGADSLSLVKGVLRQGASLGVGGILLGWIGAAGFVRVLESRLYGVQPLDVLTFVGAALAFLAVVLAASAGPARSALRVRFGRSRARAAGGRHSCVL